MINNLSKLYRWFKKPKTTIYILLILLILYFLGLLIPQKVFFKSRAEYDAWIAVSTWLHRFFDFMDFTSIYVAPITIFFLATFFLNLLLVTLDRIPIILKKAYLIGDATPGFGASEIKRSRNAKAIEMSSRQREKTIDIVTQYFKSKGWFVIDDTGRGVILAVKNRLSILGFLMFHLSFFVLLIGGLLIFYSRFSGNVSLTEGQWFEGDIKQFHKIHRQPKMMFALPALQFYLNKVTMVYEEGQPSELKVDIRVRHEERESEHVVGVNRPIRLGNLTMLSNKVGVSPLFILRNAKDGSEIDGAWVSLNVLKGEEDHFTFEKKPDLTFYARFFPDYVVDEEGEGSRSPEIKNPAFYLNVKIRSVTIAEGTVKPGQAMVFEPYMLEFADLRHWAEFYIVREVGPTPLIIGFSLAIAGLIMRLIFYRREVKVAIEDGKIYLTGTAQLYEYSFQEEMDFIEEELRGELEISGDL